MEPAPKLPPKPIREQAKVLYAYEAQNDDELTIREGDIINVISKEIEDQGWYKGELNGRIGVFPDNFVELIRLPLDDDKPVPPRPKGAPPPSSNTSSNTPSSASKSILTKAHSITDGNVSSSTSTNKSTSDSILRTSGIFGLPKKVTKSGGSLLGSSSSAKVVSKPSVLTHSASVDSDHAESNNNNNNNASNNNNNNDSNTFGGIESSIKLSHPTANRPKGPSNRRPPSYIASSPSSSATHGKDGLDGESIENGDSSSNGITSTNGSTTHTGPAKATSTAAATIEPVSRNTSAVTSPGNKGNKEDPPWMVELRKTQELKRTKTQDSSPIASTEKPVTNETDSTPTPLPPRASNRASGDFSSRLSSFATPSSASASASNTSQYNSNNPASASAAESTPTIGSSILKPTKPAKPTTNASSPTSASSTVPFGATSATNNSNFNSSHNSKLNAGTNAANDIQNSPIVLELQRELKYIKENYVPKKDYDDLVKQVSNCCLLILT